MNLERLNQAINIMKRAGNVSMCNWQSKHPICTNEVDLHKCGTAACFAGWVAVSPEFQNAGGSVSCSGAPLYKGYESGDAIIEWLEAEGITALTLELIISGRCVVNTADAMSFKEVVRKDDGKRTLLKARSWAEWTAKDVIKALETLL